MKTLLSERTIRHRVNQLGKRITIDYEGQPIVLLCVLKGSFMFTADLARQIHLPMKIAFLGLKSYDNTKSSGAVQITHDLDFPIENANVLVVEDIVDTGLTSRYLLDMLEARSPKSVKLCSLLHKPAKTIKEVKIDYLGFTIEDKFVIGYGLDYNQDGRNLPEIKILPAAPD